MLYPVQQMLERANDEMQESDSAYFDALMYSGELVLKLVVAGMVAAVRNDKGRHRYRVEHGLVRADGLGDWEKALREVLTGPSAQFLDPDAYPTQNQLIQWEPESSWQAVAVGELSESLRSVGLEDQRTNNKGVQGLQWFRDFVHLRNGTRGHGAPSATAKGTACPSLERSISVIASNLQIFAAPWAYLRQNQSNKYRVSTWGNTNENFETLRRDSDHSYPDGVYIGLSDLRRVELVDSNPEKTDCWVANGRFKNNQYQMLSYLTNRRHYVSSTPYLSPAEKLPPSATQGLGRFEVMGQSHTNLPQLSSQYVRRKKLENELEQQLIATDHRFVVTLTGRGGIGKTSTALHVITKLMESSDCPYEVVVWFSSRDVDLLSDGPKDVEPHGVSIDDFASEYAKLMNPGEKTHKRFKPEEYLARHLTNSDFKTLFVFDNFETTASPIEVFHWLETYIRGPNKVLITSRDGSFTGDYVVRVPGMTDAEAEELIDQTARSLGLVSRIDSAYIDTLIEESDGHPYFIKLLLGEFARDPNVRKPERIMAGQEEALRALFERSFNKLSSAAQRVFLTLCRWRSSVPSLGLEAVLMRPDNERIDVQKAITELLQTSFVERSEAGKDRQPELNVPLAARIFGSRKLSVSVWRGAIEEDVKMLQLLGPANRRGLTPDFGDRVRRLFENVADELSTGKREIAKVLPVLQFITTRYSPASILLADLVSKLGLGRAEEERYLVNYVEGPESPSAPAWEIWRRIADIRRERDEMNGELDALAHACSRGGAPEYALSELANRINGILRGMGSNPVSENQMTREEKQFIIRDVVRVLDVNFKKLNPDELSSATDLSRLAWLQLHLDESDAARETVSRGLTIDPNNSYCKNLAERLEA